MKKGAASNANASTKQRTQSSSASGKKRAGAQTKKVTPPAVKPRSPQASASPLIATVLPGLQRWFVIAVAALVLVVLIVITAQNAPRWLSALASAAATPQGVDPVGASAQDDLNRIGIVSGHRGNDSGTVCADGLTEAQVNFDHATRVADFLRAQGYTVDILDEFDSRLKGYRALALLSIHADSCAYINDLATGYKVARALESHVPEAEDRLVACVASRYKQATGLRFHANTVTRDMTEYHAFGEIAPETPAAIIETGFMYLDRPLLTRQPERVAQGIADGLLCFLRGDAP